MNTITRKAHNAATSKAHDKEGSDFTHEYYPRGILIAIELAGLVAAYAATDLGHHAAALELCALAAAALRVVEPRLAGMVQTHGGRKETGTTLVPGTWAPLGRRRAARLLRAPIRAIELGRID